MDLQKTLEELLEEMGGREPIPAGDIPDLPLYMDQVTTLMESALGHTRRRPEDPILTKTMINNYAKTGLLPAPEKKKYTRDHLLVLIFIYYFKNVLSFKDLEEIISPVVARYFGAQGEVSLSRIYELVHAQERENLPRLKNQIRDLHRQVGELLPKDLPKKEGEDLWLFLFLCALGTNVYRQKMLLERLIDRLEPKKEDSAKKENKREKKPKKA